MKIGEVAQATQTSLAAIRFYESVRLLPPPSRSGSNYRIYETAHVKRLAFIRRCRAFDMTLEEIRRLLEVIDSPGKTCDAVNRVLDAHIEDVAKRIQDLNVLSGDLNALRALCDEGRPVDRCGILGELSDADNG